jgi:predicted deacylase
MYTGVPDLEEAEELPAVGAVEFIQDSPRCGKTITGQVMLVPQATTRPTGMNSTARLSKVLLGKCNLGRENQF